MNGNLSPSGVVTFKVIRSQCPAEPRELTFMDVVRFGLPKPSLSKNVNKYRTKNIFNLIRGLWRIAVSKIVGVSNLYGVLYAKIYRADGTCDDYGMISARVVTTAGVTEVATRFAGTTAANIANFKFHGIGTGTNAEAIGDTALQTELTTQYSPDSTRATGSQAASTNTYTTIGTNTVDATAAITEHGILTQAGTGGGTLLDRSVFAALNLVSGDSLQTTYVLTLAAGG